VVRRDGIVDARPGDGGGGGEIRGPCRSSDNAVNREARPIERAGRRGVGGNVRPHRARVAELRGEETARRLLSSALRRRKEQAERDERTRDHVAPQPGHYH